MNSQPPSMNRETALRIALAARALPEVGVGRLLDILHQRIEGELDEESLQRVTVTDRRPPSPAPTARKTAKTSASACRR